jgi:hypothetical protein
MAFEVGKAQNTAYAKDKWTNRVAEISMFNAELPKEQSNVITSLKRARNANSSCDLTKGISLRNRKLSLANVLENDFYKQRLR